MMNPFPSFAVMAGIAMTSAPARAVVINNASFEANTNPDPGYGVISGWTSSGSSGVSTQTQPFLNQTAHDGNNAAFIQQAAGPISQSVSGYDPSKLYTVTYFVSERGVAGASTTTSVSLDGGATSFAYADSIVKTDRFRRIVSGPLAVSGATSSLRISKPDGPGDDSLLIDSVSITRAVPRVPDGGFENPVQPNTDVNTRYELGNGGGGGTLAGSLWVFGNNPSGITRNASAFGPPAAPEGSQAGLLRSNNQFTTTVGGFEAGVTYSLSFEAAGRLGSPNDFQVLLDGVALAFGGTTDLDPTTNAYQSFTSDGFTTSGGSFELAFRGLIAGDNTVFIDDVRFNFVAEAIPEPSSVFMIGLGSLAFACRRRR